eukprot:GDKH01002794.1.p1 GENE.GDKH01002794.1~~GDKH01002794.1.p1  ORF type:complete len:185 (-),score=47.81 GDKH01002794.1:242-796(-)
MPALRDQKIDWPALREKLPMEKTPEQKERRKEMFKQFDPNGNGFLSLAELDKGIKDILGADQLFDCKPAVMRAYQRARNCAKSKKGEQGDSYVEFKEFRMFLVYLRQYFELWQMMDEIDTSDDDRITLAEFKAAIPKLQEWGAEIEDPEAAFKEADANGGGVLLFDEFAAWALSKGLDLADDDD